MNAPAGMHVAPLTHRITAVLIDQMLIMLAVIATALMLGYRTGHHISSIQAFAILAVLLGAGFVYETLMVRYTTRTIGKFVARTRVVRVSDGARPDWSAATTRALVPLAFGVIPKVGILLGLLVYAWAFFNPLRQGLHDKAAATVVVLDRRRPFRRQRTREFQHLAELRSRLGQ